MGMYNLMSELQRRDTTMTIEPDCRYPLPVFKRPMFKVTFSRINTITDEEFKMTVYIDFANVEKTSLSVEDILEHHLERFTREYSLATTFVDNWKKEDLR